MRHQQDRLKAGSLWVLLQWTHCQWGHSACLCTCKEERKHMYEHESTPPPPPAAAVLTLIIMTFLYHNNAIRCVFYDSSHLRYRCQQSKICHYLHDRDRAFCNYWACLCGNYFSLLNYKSCKEGREEPRPWAETEIFFRRLKSWETFLGSGIITYTHLPETVDRKYALSAEITTLFFSLSLFSHHPLLSSPPCALTVWRETKLPSEGYQ